MFLLIRVVFLPSNTNLSLHLFVFPVNLSFLSKSRTTKHGIKFQHTCLMQRSALPFSTQIGFLSFSYNFSFLLPSRATSFSVKLQAIDHSVLQCFIQFPLFVSDPDLAWAHYSSHLIPLSYWSRVIIYNLQQGLYSLRSWAIYSHC